MTSLFWFRQDLRLTDNAALHAACTRGPVVPVYIWSPEEKPWAPGGASKWWLERSLASLDASLRKRGSKLILRIGNTGEVLKALAKECKANALYFNRRYEPAISARDTKLAAALRKTGLEVECADDALLFDPLAIRTGQGTPYQVFTQFWNRCLAEPAPPEPRAAPKIIPKPSAWPKSAALAELTLSPKFRWDAGLQAAWTPGEVGAQAQLRTFLKEGMAEYAVARDYPSRAGVSRLSPHLHFGEISARTVYHRVREALPSRGAARDSGLIYLKEIGWREFAYNLLIHFPQTPEQPLREKFAKFPWASNAKGLRAWQRGQTGYPLVDAGMRELWQTGWMHNRVRMIVASFLVKHLRIEWLEGARWFWDTLVDADLASNTLGWQWSAGCGADAAPYFRIFNPILQSQKFDPDGAYIRRYVPELAQLPNDCIHAPWEAPPLVLAEAGVRLGATYPRPIVEHVEARAAALAAFAKFRG